ncbi:hypothetical protein H5410_034789 [Solanum commersonii]|uniref:Uncharacterized protein n=1 Tax=Solanum commersonii TaxID=4109 RepID=A0A9J5YRM5_SOLCO|nr:hypothetical protein H5410_034789 [Solanum commersonii]
MVKEIGPKSGLRDPIFPKARFTHRRLRNVNSKGAIPSCSRSRKIRGFKKRTASIGSSRLGPLGFERGLSGLKVVDLGLGVQGRFKRVEKLAFGLMRSGYAVYRGLGYARWLNLGITFEAVNVRLGSRAWTWWMCEVGVRGLRGGFRDFGFGSAVAGARSWGSWGIRVEELGVEFGELGSSGIRVRGIGVEVEVVEVGVEGVRGWDSGIEVEGLSSGLGIRGLRVEVEGFESSGVRGVEELGVRGFEGGWGSGVGELRLSWGSGSSGSGLGLGSWGLGFGVGRLSSGRIRGSGIREDSGGRVEGLRGSGIWGFGELRIRGVRGFRGLGIRELGIRGWGGWGFGVEVEFGVEGLGFEVRGFGLRVRGGWGFGIRGSGLRGFEVEVEVEVEGSSGLRGSGLEGFGVGGVRGFEVRGFRGRIRGFGDSGLRLRFGVDSGFEVRGWGWGWGVEVGGGWVDSGELRLGLRFGSGVEGLVRGSGFGVRGFGVERLRGWGFGLGGWGLRLGLSSGLGVEVEELGVEVEVEGLGLVRVEVRVRGWGELGLGFEDSGIRFGVRGFGELGFGGVRGLGLRFELVRGFRRFGDSGDSRIRGVEGVEDWIRGFGFGIRRFGVRLGGVGDSGLRIRGLRLLGFGVEVGLGVDWELFEVEVRVRGWGVEGDSGLIEGWRIGDSGIRGWELRLRVVRGSGFGEVGGIRGIRGSGLGFGGLGIRGEFEVRGLGVRGRLRLGDSRLGFGVEVGGWGWGLGVRGFGVEGGFDSGLGVPRGLVGDSVRRGWGVGLGLGFGGLSWGVEEFGLVEGLRGWVVVEGWGFGSVRVGRGLRLRFESSRLGLRVEGLLAGLRDSGIRGSGFGVRGSGFGVRGWVESDRDLIEALIPLWDSTSNVFRFSDFELTPTLEELWFHRLGKDLQAKHS